MAGKVKIAVVSAALSTTPGGTTDFTKSGFGTPKACIVLLSFDATDDTAVAAEGKASIGFSDFTNQFCITHQDEDGSAKVDCDALKSNTRAYVVLNVAGAVDFSGSASTIADGVRLTHAAAEAPASALFATVIMFGGADLAIDLRRTVIASAQNGTATIPHSGFTDGNDKLIFFIGTDIAGEDNSSSGINNAFGVCYATGSDAGGWTLVQRCLGWVSDHNANVGAPSAILSTNRVLDIITEAGVQDWGLEVTNLDHAPAEWTVTTRDNGAGAGMEVYSFALDIDDRKAKVGSVDSPISGASWTPTVALGFTPQYVGLGLTHLPTEDTIDSGPDAGAQGISSNTGAGEETFHGWYNEDASLVTNTNNNFRSRVIDFRDDDVATVVQDHSHFSFNVGDWTYTINTENEVTARKWFYWAIEEATPDEPLPEGQRTQIPDRAPGPRRAATVAYWIPNRIEGNVPPTPPPPAEGTTVLPSRAPGPRRAANTAYWIQNRLAGNVPPAAPGQQPNRLLFLTRVRGPRRTANTAYWNQNRIAGNVPPEPVEPLPEGQRTLIPDRAPGPRRTARPTYQIDTSFMMNILTGTVFPPPATYRMSVSQPLRFFRRTAPSAYWISNELATEELAEDLPPGMSLLPSTARGARRGSNTIYWVANLIEGNVPPDPPPVTVGADLPPYGQVIFNSADEENRPRFGQRIARGTEE